MTDALTQFQAIRAERNAASASLKALEAPVLAQFTSLVNKKNRGQTLTTAEQNDLANLNATLDRVHHAMWIVGQISLQAMNDSPLLRDIKNSLNGISRDLKGAKKKLDHIAKIASTTAKVTEVLVKLAEKVGKAAI